MRQLNRGENLVQAELEEIASKYYITSHAKIRMLERGLNEEAIKKIILNPLVAYFNTDGTINIAQDKNYYLVVRYDSYYDNYVVITYKEPSRNGKNIFEKQQLAIEGKDRIVA